jgi:predicted deacetylase
MLPRPAKYLLRIDDLCPTVSRVPWQRFAALIEEFNVRPILAVVPENHDPDLKKSPPDSQFWEQMRVMESMGAAIGLHGYRHLCAGRGTSLLPLHRISEFAGADPCTQREWIRAGLKILRGHGLTPEIWVAPRHGFDRNTLAALRAEGIPALSDGLARFPFTRAGLTWIPQQLWAPLEKPNGVWTICMHPNTAGDAEIEQLRTFLRGHANQFTSVNRVLAMPGLAELRPPERLYELLALWRVQASRFSKQLRLDNSP